MRSARSWSRAVGPEMPRAANTPSRPSTGAAIPVSPVSSSSTVVAKRCRRIVASSAAQRLAGGDGAVGAPLEPAGRDGQHVEGVEHLAERRAVRGYVDLVPVARRQQEGRLDLGDVHDVLAAAHAEVDGLAGLLADGLQDRPGQAGDLRPRVVQRGVQREQRTGDVPAGGVALDELGALQRAPAVARSWSGPGRSRRSAR